MIITARVVLTMDGPPLAHGAVAVVANRISAVGPLEQVVASHRGEIIDLGDRVLLPGLINAHCHLDYTLLWRAIAPPRSFTAWVQRINALKRSLDTEDYLAAVARGFSELKRWGTTAVCNVESFPELMPRLPPAPIRTWWFYEMIDVRHRKTPLEVVAGALGFFRHRDRPLEAYGLSPHAPYTASMQLYQLANKCASRFQMPLTTHVAESAEEFDMFNGARGPLYEFMRSLGRPMEGCGGVTPFTHLWGHGAINSDWLLVHMNELTEPDFLLLASLPRGHGPSIVHCPGSHRYFSHAPFPLRRLSELGINVCVGTDSLASTESLSLLHELHLLWKKEPSLGAEELLRMVTINAARALRLPGQLGIIAAGALADLIALPTSGNIATIHEDVVRFAEPIRWMMIDGNVVSP